MRFSPILLLLFATLGCGSESQSVDEPVETQVQAIPAIENLGGKVPLDEKSSNKQVIYIGFSGTRVTDKGLKHLKGLTSLQTLNLSRTRVTDAGLEHLKGLIRLQDSKHSRIRLFVLCVLHTQHLLRMTSEHNGSA